MFKKFFHLFKSWKPMKKDYFGMDEVLNKLISTIVTTNHSDLTSCNFKNWLHLTLHSLKDFGTGWLTRRVSRAIGLRLNNLDVLPPTPDLTMTLVSITNVTPSRAEGENFHTRLLVISSMTLDILRRPIVSFRFVINSGVLGPMITMSSLSKLLSIWHHWLCNLTTLYLGLGRRNRSVQVQILDVLIGKLWQTRLSCDSIHQQKKRRYAEKRLCSRIENHDELVKREVDNPLRTTVILPCTTNFTIQEVTTVTAVVEVLTMTTMTTMVVQTKLNDRHETDDDSHLMNDLSSVVTRPSSRLNFRKGRLVRLRNVLMKAVYVILFDVTNPINHVMNKVVNYPIPIGTWLLQVAWTIFPNYRNYRNPWDNNWNHWTHLGIMVIFTGPQDVHRSTLKVLDYYTFYSH